MLACGVISDQCMYIVGARSVDCHLGSYLMISIKSQLHDNISMLKTQ